MKNDTSDRVNTSVSYDGNDDTHASRPSRFALGLAAGTMIGVGVGLWLAPRASTLRQWLDDSARELGADAAERYERSGDRVAAAVDGLATTAQGVRDAVADTVIRAAADVERLATAAKG